ncbi:MAG: hypothetical protein U0R69_10310 [Gaiellales bacterium]
MNPWSMVIRIAVIGVLAIAIMLLVKDGRVVRELEVVSRCEVVATPTGQVGTWQACTAGRIDGRKDLSELGCEKIRSTKDIDIWQCLPQKL